MLQYLPTHSEEQGMIERTMAKTAKKLWSKYPIITITGPRQSGKTTLAKAIFPDAEYVNLEIPDVREEALRDARGFMQRHKAPVIFDEIQNAPQSSVTFKQHQTKRGATPCIYSPAATNRPSKPPSPKLLQDAQEYSNSYRYP